MFVLDLCRILHLLLINTRKYTFNNDKTQKVATARKLKSRQTTTFLGKIPTETSKPRIGDKERWFRIFWQQFEDKNVLRSPYHEHKLIREMAGDQSAVVIIQLSN